jgi:tRNA(Arg) A34 adenosine deaminase TadA
MKKIIHKNDYDIILYAIELAKKSNMENKHGCVIVDNKGNIISVGFNKMLCIPKNKIEIFNKNTRVKISNHAEEVALKKADPKKLNGAKLYIIRLGITKDYSTLMNSKPCKRCTSIIESCIKRFGIKAVYHT